MLVSLLLALLLVLTACQGGTTNTATDATNNAPNDVAGETTGDTPGEAGFVHQQVITAEALAGILDDPDLLLLDARSADDYAAGHIPGAINTPWELFSQMDLQPGDDDYAVLLPPDELSEVLSSIGVDENKRIVVYGDPNSFGEDGRVMWMLDMIGLTNVQLLNGGWVAWQALGGEISREAATPTPSDFVVTTIDDTTNVTTEWLLENMDKVHILDTRSLEEYDGTRDIGPFPGGHIPGAVHLYFKELNDDNALLKSPEEIEAMLTELGIGKDDPIVTYCTVGIRSAYVTMVLKMAGYTNVKNYDASIMAWAGQGLPLE